MPLKECRHPISIRLLVCMPGRVEENQNPMKKWRGSGAPSAYKEGADYRVEI